VSIDDWRRRIDELDQELVKLLNERARCALEIGHEKHKKGLPVYQPDRENEILANVERVNPGPLADTAVRRLFERIIDEARALERAVQHEDSVAEGAKHSKDAKPGS
jgi:chorismate mutase